MVAFNFKKEFVEPILIGSKVATTRLTQRCKVGDILQLYTGQRTKNCKKFGEAVCIGVGKISVDMVTIWKLETGLIEVLKQQNKLPLHNQLGFQNAVSMVNFYGKQYGLPFVGYIHIFKVIKPDNYKDFLIKTKKGLKCKN